MILSTPFLLLVLTVVYPASADDCIWTGTAPHCGGTCTPDYPTKVTIGRGLCQNGNHCISGHKVLCCSSSFNRVNCHWVGKAQTTCGEGCPAGKSQVSVSDIAGDGHTCYGGGCKIFCCDDVA